MSKYRFDDSVGKVYEFHTDLDSYVFLCTYVQAGIACKMKQCTKAEKVEEWKDNNDLS